LSQSSVTPDVVDSFYDVVHVPLQYTGLVPGESYAIVLGQQTPQQNYYEWVTGIELDAAAFFGKSDGATFTDESELGEAWLKVITTP
jgi:hypothetical protein